MEETVQTWLIYKHTLILDCPEKGKSYIGLTNQIDPKYRWGYKGAHYSGQLFGRIIKKYGWDNFTHEIIETNIITIELACEREQYWIAYYHTYIEDPDCFGWNLTSGGQSKSKLSEDTKKRIANSIRGMMCSDSAKKKLSERVVSEETKLKMSKSHKGQQINAPIKIVCVETGIEYESIKAARRITGIPNIFSYKLDTESTAGGFHWARIK